MDLEERFPLFPLPLVALPGEEIVLHIFEVRYRTMIDECIDAPREFGIVWLADDELKPVGCTCEVERVLQREEDGRFYILARGRRPFRLVARDDSLAYPAGTIELLVDEQEAPDDAAVQSARGDYAALVMAATDSEPERLEELSAYEMAGTVDFGLAVKQQLLELRSENERLRLLAQMLRDALGQLELAGRALARARSNGKVRFS